MNDDGLTPTITSGLMNLVQAFVVIVTTYGSSTVPPKTLTVQLAYALPVFDIATYMLMFLYTPTASVPWIAARYYTFSRVTITIKWIISSYLLFTFTSKISSSKNRLYDLVSLGHTLLLFIISILSNTLNAVSYVKISQGGPGLDKRTLHVLHSTIPVILISLSSWTLFLLHRSCKNQMVQKGLMSTLAILLLAIGLFLNPDPSVFDYLYAPQVFGNAFTMGITQLITLRCTQKTHGNESSVAFGTPEKDDFEVTGPPKYSEQ
jgi:hypothetical protein